jgi:ABC-2 type transport system permease protein
MSPIARVMVREVRRLPRLPVLWALLLPIPVGAGLLLTGVFAAQVARQLPIGALDFDGTQASRLVVRWAGAARTVNIVSRVQDLDEAESLLLRRKLYAVLVVPRHFERDLLHQRSPRVTLLYNEQYLTAGNLISADVARSVNAASGAAAETAAQSIRVDSRLLFNPAINYARGVGLVLIVGLVQVVAGLSTIYVVGRELRDGTAGEWLDTAGGSPVGAWIGKLTPYLCFDLILSWFLVGGFIAWFRIPVLGSIGFLILGAAAFAVATIALGVLLTVWTANLRQALGVGSILFGSAVAFSGVTFPRIAMSGFARGWGDLVPLTRFMELLRDQVMVGAPLGVSAEPVLVLSVMTLLAGLLASPRMGRVLRDHRFWGRE